MFTLDYLHIYVALVLFATLPVVLLWPDEESRLRRQEERWRSEQKKRQQRQQRTLPKTIPYPGPNEETYS